MSDRVERTTEQGAHVAAGAPSPRRRRPAWLRPLLLVAAAALVVGSYFLTNWQVTLHAPQYPDGLTVRIAGTGLSGDVSEVDELNHYIGFPKMSTLGHPEIGLWSYGIALLAAIYLLAAVWRNRLTSLLAVAGATYPVIFAIDLYRWLKYAGTHLDPTAPLNGAIPPFVPGFLGGNMVGQFSTYSMLGPGYWMAVAASLLALVAGIMGLRRGRAR